MFCATAVVSGMSSLILFDDKYATEYLCGGEMHRDRVVMFEDEPTHRPLICEWHAKKKEAQPLDEAARAPLTQSVGSVVPSNIMALIFRSSRCYVVGRKW